MPVPIGIVGLIKNEGVREPYVFVQDDGYGGYLVLTSSNHDFVTGTGFDNWILQEYLEKAFEEWGWTVEWELGPSRADPLSLPKEPLV